MSDLTGNLTSFGVRQILRFLAETGQTGEVRVTAGELIGRILFQDGAVAYATTARDADAVQELDSLLERYQSDDFSSSGRSDAGVADGSPTVLETVLGEQLTEVLYHLTQLEEGSFEYWTDTASSENVHMFGVEDLLGRVDIRIEEWRKIREVVPSTEAPYQLVSRIADDWEVTIDARAWSLLSAVGGGGSVAEVAALLNEYEFYTAGTYADLVKRGLLEPVGEPVAPAVADTMIDFFGDEGLTEDEAEEAVPPVRPSSEAVTFSTKDLSPDEINEVIRNIGRGIFPS